MQNINFFAIHQLLIATVYEWNVGVYQAWFKLPLWTTLYKSPYLLYDLIDIKHKMTNYAWNSTFTDIFSQRFIFPFSAVCLLLCSSCQTWLKSPRMKSVSSKATLFPFSALHSVWPQWEWIFLYVEQPFGWSFPKWGWTKTACFRQTMNWGNQVWNNKDYFYLIHVKLLQQSLRIKY